MQQVKRAGIRIIRQLHEAVEIISDDHFKKPVEVLGNSTIGQHCRHIIEFFECLEAGALSGTVNYDQRKRSLELETCRQITLDRLLQTESFISSLNENINIQLESGFNPQVDEQIVIPSTLLRELAFTIDHAVHHMALIKAGLRYILPDQKLDAGFGVAFSTLLHHKSQIPATQMQ